ncbi:MAG TPA: acylphosphatase [Candidatus Kapabacteria bacterium]|nr:acylphosphatase [Candidatus Kapabacteria bacterium]
MKAMFLHIIGHVQGVFFRQGVKDEANRLGLTGWVRNEHDGSVTVYAEGEEHILRLLNAYCYHGPPGAKVETVHVEWTDTVGNGYRTFDIVKE